MRYHILLNFTGPQWYSPQTLKGFTVMLAFFVVLSLAGKGIMMKSGRPLIAGFGQCLLPGELMGSFVRLLPVHFSLQTPSFIRFVMYIPVLNGEKLTAYAN